jgi:hypothetical protein
VRVGPSHQFKALCIGKGLKASEAKLNVRMLNQILKVLHSLFHKFYAFRFLFGSGFIVPILPIPAGVPPGRVFYFSTDTPTK